MLTRREVDWYKRHGRYAERIRLDASDHEYVEGDWSWNRTYLKNPEHIEDRMRRDGVYKGVEWKTSSPTRKRGRKPFTLIRRSQRAS